MSPSSGTILGRNTTDESGSRKRLHSGSSKVGVCQTPLLWDQSFGEDEVPESFERGPWRRSDVVGNRRDDRFVDGLLVPVFRLTVSGSDMWRERPSLGFSIPTSGVCWSSGIVGHVGSGGPSSGGVDRCRSVRSSWILETGPTVQGPGN